MHDAVAVRRDYSGTPGMPGCSSGSVGSVGCSCPTGLSINARRKGLACTGCRVQQGKSFFQVERGEHTTEVVAQFDHGEGHVGIDTDDHRAGAAEIRHSGDVPQVRVPKESSTSSAATSMTMPRARSRPTLSISSCWNRRSWLSSSAVWIDAMRWAPCRRIETSAGGVGGPLSLRIVWPDHCEAEDPFC